MYDIKCNDIFRYFKLQTRYRMVLFIAFTQNPNQDRNCGVLIVLCNVHHLIHAVSVRVMTYIIVSLLLLRHDETTTFTKQLQ